MNEYMVFLKDFLRPFRDILYTFCGFNYDFLRFFKHAGWKSKYRYAVRDYKSVKIYHRLEKSLSFRNRDPNAGWGAAKDLVAHIKQVEKHTTQFTYHEKVGLKVLGDFIAESSTNIDDGKSEIIKHWERLQRLSSEKGGVVEKNLAALQAGILVEPETFFLSRFSVRDFQPISVSSKDIERAIALALNTPSVCNRQASFVYCLNTRTEIDKALSLQNGNKGFGHEVPCLLILCADLSGFDTFGERYQHWIDGGMFSMSIIWALHSLGLASCCLNWSKGPIDDLKLRKLVKINNEHTVLMMLAVGLPREDIKVCYSARKPTEDFFINLD